MILHEIKNKIKECVKIVNEMIYYPKCKYLTKEHKCLLQNNLKVSPTQCNLLCKERQL